VQSADNIDLMLRTRGGFDVPTSNVSQLIADMNFTKDSYFDFHDVLGKKINEIYYQ